MKLEEIHPDQIKVAIFDFDETLALHKDKEYTKHRDESEENFAAFFARAYQEPNGFYDTVEPCERSEALYALICKLRASGTKLYCLSGMKYSFHFEAKRAFVEEHYGKDIEMLFTASQDRKLKCVKVLAKMNDCALDEVLFVDDRQDVIELLSEAGVQAILADKTLL